MKLVQKGWKLKFIIGHDVTNVEMQSLIPTSSKKVHVGMEIFVNRATVNYTNSLDQDQHLAKKNKYDKKNLLFFFV